MKDVVETGIPTLNQPFSWAVKAHGALLFTAHGPVQNDGTVCTGTIEQQARITLQNLERAVCAAGASLGDVAQVLIYMTDVHDMAAIDQVYREFFQSPYPNRASVAVQALVVPGMRIELVAYVSLNH
jgi:enamine deaminase RidA (YjgF/YER057c/UK114 family)